MDRFVRLGSWWLLVSVAFASPLGAGEPILLRNVNTDSNEAFLPVPRFLAGLPDAAVFQAWRPVDRANLWRSDGTPQGTGILVDVAPEIGQIGSVAVGTLGGLTFVSVESGSGRALWRTDGTAAGSFPVTEVDDFSGSEVFRGLGTLESAGILFFAAPSGLMRTDGSRTGTQVIGPGLTSLAAGAVAGGRILVSAAHGDSGFDLWRSDGTAAGTSALRLLASFTATNFWDGRFATLGARVLFDAVDGATGRELWVSDGTPGGTALVKDLTPGAASTEFPDPFAAAATRVYFFTNGPAGRQLWRSDGTAVGTTSLHNFGSGTNRPFGLVGLGERSLFTFDDGVHGREPWVSDGSPVGTKMLLDVCPGGCESVPRVLGEIGGRIVFEADDGVAGREPWATDGTSLGTRRLGDLCPEDCSASLANGIVALGSLFLGSGSSGLWRTDGTPAGTVHLSNVVPASSFGVLEAATAGSSLVFAVDQYYSQEIWVTDGTPAGTQRIADVDRFDDAGSYPSPSTVLGAKFYLTAIPIFSPRRIYVSDGTPAGTGVLTATFPSELLETELAPQRVGDRLVFFLRGPFEEMEVWASDGTAAGTHAVADLPRFINQQSETAVFAGRLFFFTFPSGFWRTDGTEAGTIELSGFSSAAMVPWRNALHLLVDQGDSQALWRTDGTVAGTVDLLDLPPDVGGLGPPVHAAALGDVLYLLARSPAGAPELWRTDGTQAGTMLVSPIHPPALGPVTGALTAFAGRLFFVSADEEHGRELWVSDGTAAGTHVLVEISPGARGAGVRDLVVFGGRLWFVASDGVHGAELWSTDGSAGGTRMLTDLWPGPAGSSPLSLTPLADRLLFTASDGLHGFELWQTNGTAGGTRRLTDIAAGPASSLPADFTVAGDLLLMNASNDEFGREPWALRLDAIPPPDPEGAVPAAPGDLTAEAVSTSAVRLTWHDNSSDEDSFTVEASWPESGFVPVATPPAGSTFVEIGGLTAGTPYTFRVRAENADGASDWSDEASATPFREGAGPCAASAQALCLLDGRFEVRVQWHDQHNGGHGLGTAVPFPGSGKTGLFWFFNPANIELVVKNLDGSTVNGFIWTFYGALSDVEYWITVTDTQEGRNRTYHNSPGTICGQGDTASFPEAAPAGAVPAEATAVPLPAAGLGPFPAGGSGPCTPGPLTLCLQDGRFAVEVDWHDQHNGGDGVGTAIPSTNLSGYFWFFNPTNVELVVKVLDATTVNGHYWVFYGALSDVEYTIRVSDLETGREKSYPNPPGNICGLADTMNF